MSITLVETILENMIHDRAVLERAGIAARTGHARSAALIGRQRRAGFIDAALCNIDRLAARQQRMGKRRSAVILQRTDGVQCDETN